MFKAQFLGARPEYVYEVELVPGPNSCSCLFTLNTLIILLKEDGLQDFLAQRRRLRSRCVAFLFITLIPGEDRAGVCRIPPSIVTLVIRIRLLVIFLHSPSSSDNLPDQTCEGNVTIREIEIQEQLEALYVRLEAFEEPFPADAPFEYEVEELEAWEKLREQIRVLEHELAEIKKKEDARFGKNHHPLHQPYRQGFEKQSPVAETRQLLTIARRCHSGTNSA